MNIKPEELTRQQYVLLDKLAHNELVPFIRACLKKRTQYTIFYYLANLAVFAVSAYLFLRGVQAGNYDLANRFAHFAYGLAIAFALVPLHEYIHVVAYRSQGADNTSYAANLKKFFFMALADKFVANKKEFTVVALAPFVVISFASVILLFTVFKEWQLTIAGVLLAHTAMCSGDFGLLSYFDLNKDKQVVTFDDVENKQSYFYGLPAENSQLA